MQGFVWVVFFIKAKQAFCYPALLTVDGWFHFFISKGLGKWQFASIPLPEARICLYNLCTGGVRHDPQRFMGKTVTVPHFNPDTVEFASRRRSESNPGIKTLLPFPKIITEESDFENFQDLIVALDACYWLHKAISRSLSRFGDDRAI